MRLLLSLALTIPLSAATWYVRPDGGTAAQCVGTTDAAYPGSGSAQACAFKHPYYLFTNDAGGAYSWKIAGGDTVLIENNGDATQATYRIGYKTNASNGAWSFSGSSTTATCVGDPFSCMIPPPPSGTSGAHTRIVGQGWDTGCTGIKPMLRGGVAVSAIINLSGAQYVDVQCLEMSDYAQCGTGAQAEACVTSGFPKSDSAKNGILTSNTTTHVLLQDLDMHGFASRAIIGAVGDDTVIRNVRAAFNKSAGIDLDDGVAHQASTGTLTLDNVLVEWNGCVEEYPIVHSIPAVHCYDQSSAGYGDGFATLESANFIANIQHSVFRYNTQDGVDGLHTAAGQELHIESSQSYGNMGQQYKIGGGGDSSLRNSVAVHNCRRLSQSVDGAPATFNAALSGFCRAAGDGILLGLTPSNSIHVENNTYVGYGSTSFDVTCSTLDCSGAQFHFRNNIHRGYFQANHPTDPRWPGFIYQDPAKTWPVVDRSNNLICGIRTAEPTYPNEYVQVGGCPGDWLSSEPTFDSTHAAESALDALDIRIPASSAARDAGVTLASVPLDSRGIVRPQFAVYDIGAVEYSTADVAPAITTVTLPGGAAGAAYSQTIAATGDAPIVWSVSSGSLPTGITLSGGGVLSGTPSVGGTFSFVIQASNGAGSDTQAYSVLIGAAPVVTTASLPNGTTGTVYSQTLAATGDTPITWTVASGALPAGLLLSGAGVVSGTPAAAGTFPFTVRAANAIGTTTKDLSIAVALAPSGSYTTGSVYGSVIR